MSWPTRSPSRRSAARPSSARAARTRARSSSSRPVLPLQRAGERGVGVLAGLLLDEPAEDPAGPGLGRAVAAEVDAGAQPSGAADLDTGHHLRDRLELAAEDRAQLAPAVLAQPAEPPLDLRHGGGGVVEALVRDLRTGAERDAVPGDRAIVRGPTMRR